MPSRLIARFKAFWTWTNGLRPIVVRFDPITAALVSPGSALVVGVKRSLTEEQLDRVRAELHSSLSEFAPGTRTLVVQGEVRSYWSYRKHRDAACIPGEARSGVCADRVGKNLAVATQCPRPEIGSWRSVVCLTANWFELGGGDIRFRRSLSTSDAVAASTRMRPTGPASATDPNVRSAFLAAACDLYDLIALTPEGRQTLLDLGFQPVLEDSEREG